MKKMKNMSQSIFRDESGEIMGIFSANWVNSRSVYWLADWVSSRRTRTSNLQKIGKIKISSKREIRQISLLILWPLMASVWFFPGKSLSLMENYLQKNKKSKGGFDSLSLKLCVKFSEIVTIRFGFDFLVLSRRSLLRSTAVTSFRISSCFLFRILNLYTADSYSI